MKNHPAMIAVFFIGVCSMRLFAAELTVESLETWANEIKPTTEELSFLKINWRPTLWQAVDEARQVGKPILLWAMNGHPLGCT